MPVPALRAALSTSSSPRCQPRNARRSRGFGRDREAAVGAWQAERRRGQRIVAGQSLDVGLGDPRQALVGRRFGRGRGSGRGRAGKAERDRQRLADRCETERGRACRGGSSRARYPRPRTCALHVRHSLAIGNALAQVAARERELHPTPVCRTNGCSANRGRRLSAPVGWVFRQGEGMAFVMIATGATSRAAGEDAVRCGRSSAPARRSRWHSSRPAARSATGSPELRRRRSRRRPPPSRRPRCCRSPSSRWGPSRAGCSDSRARRRNCSARRSACSTTMRRPRARSATQGRGCADRAGRCERRSARAGAGRAGRPRRARRAARSRRAADRRRCQRDGAAVGGADAAADAAADPGCR